MTRPQTVAAAILLALTCLGATSAGAAPIISVGPYVPGPTFTVPVEIIGAVDLVTWQFDLAFDPADVQAISVSEGPFTSENGQFLTLFIPGVIDNVNGMVSIVAGAYLDVPPGPSGNGVLAYVEFTSIDASESPIVVQDPEVIDGSGSSTVPEPSTFLLLAGGLVMGVLRGRWRV